MNTFESSPIIAPNSGKRWGRIMKKSLSFILLVWMSLTFGNEKEVRGSDLHTFTEDVFNILQAESRIIDLEKLENAYVDFIGHLKQYENGLNTEIADIAEQFILSFQEGPKAKDALVEPISALGRLLKRSANEDVCDYIDTPYLLNQEELQRQIIQMESRLGERLPKGHTSYHRLMMDSLAEGKYDLALYAYLKIAEARCHL